MHLEAQQRLQEEGCVVDINAQVTGYEHGWARGKLYLFGLPGIAVSGDLLNFLPEPGPWRDRASLPWLEGREGKSMAPWESVNICWNQKVVQYP